MTRNHLARRLAPFGLAVAVLALAAPARAQDGETPRKKKKKPAPSGILDKAEQIQKDVEAIRGLKYRAPVVKGVKSVDELKKYMLDSFEKEEPKEEYEKSEKVLKRLGLIPADYDLRGETLALLGDQIAGFYDPETKQLFCIKRDGMGMPGAGGMDMDELTMAHELEHALQDQTFGLTRRSWLTSDDDDRGLAWKCVVEGEATLVGYTWMFKNRMNQDVPDLGMMNGMEKAAQKMMGGNGKKVPDFILENLTFPYLTGAEFVQKYQKKYGWDKTGALFTDPPTSSAQILHPKKFWGEREEPVQIHFAPLAKVVGTKAKELGPSTTMGEFNTQHVLRALRVSEAKAAKAAVGWRGDRYQAFELDGQVVVAWLTSWESPDSAAKFADVYRAALEKRGSFYGGFRLEQKGTEVLALAGCDALEKAEKDGALLKKIEQAAWSAEKVTEKREPLPSLVEQPPVEEFAVKGSSSSAAPAVRGAPVGARFNDTELGIAFNLPTSEWKKTEETQKDIQHFSRGKWVHGDANLRVLDLPLPFDKDEISQQFENAVKSSVKDFEKRREAARTVAGRQAIEFEFSGEMPGTTDGKREAKAVAVEREGTTLLFLMDAPMGKLEAEAAAFDRALTTLELETSPIKGERAFGQSGGWGLSSPPAFAEKASEGKPILLVLADEKGASIMVQELSGDRTVEDEARATEAFMERELEGYKLIGKSSVSRDGRGGVILEYEAKADGAAKHVRMLILDEGGKRATLACSAPADKWDAYKTAFERVQSTFKLGSAASAPAPAAKRRGKLY